MLSYLTFNHAEIDQKIYRFDNTLEINANSCAAVSGNQTKSPRSPAQHLCSSEFTKKFSSLRPEMSDVEGTDLMASLLLEKKRTLTNSIGGQHFFASPLLEKAILHCVQTDFLEAPYSMSSAMLDTYAGHTSETNSLEGIHFPVSPLQENDPLHTVGHAEQVRKRTSLSDRSINRCLKILEQKNLGSHMPHAKFSESYLQHHQLPDTTSEAPEKLG